MIFKHVCKKGNKYLAKIIFKDGEGEKWAETSQKVFNWAKKNFQENDVVDVQYSVKNGQYFVSRISVPGQGSQTSSTKEETSKPTCADCSATLKDDKYEKCYKCNQKNPSKPKTGYKKDTEAIKRQAVLKASVHAIQVMTGQIGSVEAIGDMVTSLYDRFMKKING